MDEPRKPFDWLLFFTLEATVLAMATWMLAERLHSHDRAGAVLFGVVGYVVLPTLVFFHTRRRSRRPPPRFSLWIAKHLPKRKEKLH
jgi:uncharacterized membrane protein